MNTNQYLLEGELVKMGPKIKECSLAIRGEGLELLIEILTFIHKKFHEDPTIRNKRSVLRTSNEIIDSDYVTGCTEWTIVFLALARARKIPAVYVEGIWEPWLKSNESENIMGHVVAKVKINTRWYWVDPRAGTVGVLRPHGLVIFGEGIDTYDLELRDSKILRDKFFAFRSEWQAKYLK